MKMGLFGALGKIGYAGGKYLAKKTAFTSPFVYTFAEKIKDLETAKGVTPDFINDLIQEAKDIESLKAIRDYLRSYRNDIPWNQTTQMIKQVTEKAKEIKLHEHIKENIGDPFALLESVVHYLC
jgi:predicted RNA methylase